MILRIRRSEWGRVINTTRHVNVQRVNWPGILYCNAQRRMFDPRPRLVKH